VTRHAAPAAAVPGTGTAHSVEPPQSRTTLPRVPKRPTRFAPPPGCVPFVVDDRVNATNPYYAALRTEAKGRPRAASQSAPELPDADVRWLKPSSGQGHHEMAFFAAAGLGGEPLDDLVADSDSERVRCATRGCWRRRAETRACMGRPSVADHPRRAGLGAPPAPALDLPFGAKCPTIRGLPPVLERLCTDSSRGLCSRSARASRGTEQTTRPRPQPDRATAQGCARVTRRTEQL
jgi:hypothetical protein